MPRITIDGEGGLWLRTKRRRRLLPYWCAALAVAFGMVSAQAADLGRGSLKDSSSEVHYAPLGWTGPYIGAGIGYRWQSWDAAFCEPVLDVENYSVCKPVKFSEDANGFIATGRAGYDWQRGDIVFGLFGEVNWLNANTSHFADANFSGAIGPRLGYLLTPRLLAYVNGGVEFTDFNLGLGTSVEAFGGGGLELALADGWSLAPEVRINFKDNGDLPSSIRKDDPLTARLLLLKKF